MELHLVSISETFFFRCCEVRLTNSLICTHFTEGSGIIFNRCTFYVVDCTPKIELEQFNIFTLGSGNINFTVWLYHYFIYQYNTARFNYCFWNFDSFLISTILKCNFVLLILFLNQFFFYLKLWVHLVKSTKLGDVIFNQLISYCVITDKNY